ncbi:type IV secretion system protein [Bartonella raoultii]|nr:type IV secretion system protein [Bartonella raoultii]
MHEHVEKLSEQSELLTKQFQTIQQQFKRTEKIYESITGNRITEANKKAINTLEEYIQAILGPDADITKYISDNDILLTAVPTQDEANKVNNILKSYELKNARQLISNYKYDRKYISQKVQNTIAFGENISRKSFVMAHNRFEALKKLVERIEDTNDLKSIAEIQASIRFLSSAIQNEIIKFQILTDSYNNQEELLNQRKQQLYATVFRHTNTHMPSLRSITKKF